MRADMKVSPPRGFRERLTARLKAKVRLWVDGHQYRYFDVPGDQRLTWEYPAYPTIKLLETDPHEGGSVQIGKYAGIHYSVVAIPGGLHHADWVSTVHAHVEDGEWVNTPGGIYSAGPIVIGNDAFIAFEAVICSGVTIGDGAIVATRAVVVRDVEPYSIVGGNPAKHIKYRFDEPTRAALLRIRWWDWSPEKVAAHKDQIHCADVAGFVARHDPDLGTSDCTTCRTGPA